METPTLSLPRLRLTRFNHITPSYLENNSFTPIAGPSRLSPDFKPAAKDSDSTDEEDDAESTPRLSTSAIVPDRHSPRSSSQATLAAETPAARLRALLARVPNTSSSLQNFSARAPVPPSPSEPDSDFDAPSIGFSTRSIARESVRDIFSHALREAGDTPRRERPRRNSDVSEVESSPRVELVQEERAKNKGKRRSMSDEEAEKAASKYLGLFFAELMLIEENRTCRGFRELLSAFPRCQVRRIATATGKVDHFAFVSALRRGDGHGHVDATS